MENAFGYFDHYVTLLLYYAIIGTLPPEIGNIRRLKLLYVSFNSFSGSIPESWFVNFTHMLDFRTAANSLTGIVCDIWCAYSNRANHYTTLYRDDIKCCINLDIQYCV